MPTSVRTILRSRHWPDGGLISFHHRLLLGLTKEAAFEEMSEEKKTKRTLPKFALHFQRSSLRRLHEDHALLPLDRVGLALLRSPYVHWIPGTQQDCEDSQTSSSQTDDSPRDPQNGRMLRGQGSMMTMSCLVFCGDAVLAPRILVRSTELHLQVTRHPAGTSTRTILIPTPSGSPRPHGLTWGAHHTGTLTRIAGRDAKSDELFQNFPFSLDCPKGQIRDKAGEDVEPCSFVDARRIRSRRLAPSTGATLLRTGTSDDPDRSASYSDSLPGIEEGARVLVSKAA